MMRVDLLAPVRVGRRIPWTGILVALAAMALAVIAGWYYGRLSAAVTAAQLELDALEQHRAALREQVERQARLAAEEQALAQRVAAVEAIRARPVSLVLREFQALAGPGVTLESVREVAAGQLEVRVLVRSLAQGAQYLRALDAAPAFGSPTLLAVEVTPGGFGLTFAVKAGGG